MIGDHWGITKMAQNKGMDMQNVWNDKGVGGPDLACGGWAWRDDKPPQQDMMEKLNG